MKSLGESVGVEWGEGVKVGGGGAGGKENKMKQFRLEESLENPRKESLE